MRVYMVHSEHGEWSEWTYNVKGVFSTYDYAKEYIESQGITFYHHVGKKYGSVADLEYDQWDDDERPYYNPPGYFYVKDKIVDTRTIFPKMMDARTFGYILPDGKRADDWYDTYFIDEYEVDGERG